MDDIDKTLIMLGDKKITDSQAIVVLAASLYLPFFCSMAALAALFVAVIANPRARKAVFGHKSSWLLYGFFAFSTTASVIGGNWLGALVNVFIFATVTVGLYLVAVMTRDIFMKVIRWIFRLMPIVTAAALIEFAVRFWLVEINDQKIRFMTRCFSFFFNPNYFGTVAAMTALICIYHFIAFRAERKKSVGVGICAVICLLLSQSLFSCVELLAGAIVLLIVSRRWKYLGIMTGCLLAAAAAVVIFPGIVPRLAESGETFGLRLSIWRVSAEAFKSSPFIGQGPLTYFHTYGDYIDKLPGVSVWATQHAHNILFDSLLSFGILGAALMWSYVGVLSAHVLRSLRQGGDVRISGLVAAVCVGALVHGMVDMTLLWPQTGMLFMLIIAASRISQENNDQSHDFS